MRQLVADPLDRAERAERGAHDARLRFGGGCGRGHAEPFRDAACGGARLVSRRGRRDRGCAGAVVG